MVTCPWLCRQTCGKLPHLPHQTKGTAYPQYGRVRIRPVCI